MGETAYRELTREEEKAYMHDKNDKLKETVRRLFAENQALRDQLAAR